MGLNKSFLEVVSVPNTQTTSWNPGIGTKPISFVQYTATRALGGTSVANTEVAQLRSFEQLPPNWNSYGAKPVSRDAVNAATDLLMRVMGAVAVHPDVLAPVATGAIQMEWFGTDAEIEVRANPDKTFTYLRTKGDEYSEQRNTSMYHALAAVIATLAE